MRDRGGILLLALFSGQVKDIAESPTPIASKHKLRFWQLGACKKNKDDLDKKVYFCGSNKFV